MGHRIRIAIATLAVIVAASCAHPVGTTPTASGASQSQEPRAASPAVRASATAALPFRSAGPQAAGVATAFVRYVAAYDARRESKLDFLDRLVAVVTSPELERLTRSPRALLPWSILRRRGERTILTVDGVTIARSLADARRVVVEATAANHTSFASLSSFRRYTLTLAFSGDRWLVSDAEGPGL